MNRRLERVDKWREGSMDKWAYTQHSKGGWGRAGTLYQTD